MNKPAFRSLLHRGIPLCVAALLYLNGGACFRSLDPSKVPCDSKTICPDGYVCSIDQEGFGHCIHGTMPIDGSSADFRLSDGPDGKAGLDGIQSSGGAGGTAIDGLMGGTGGSSIGVDGAMLGMGGAGGIVSPDAPIGTGAVASMGGMTSSSTGGTVSMGGTTSSIDAPILNDGPDAPTSLPNGSACTIDGECANGHCIDGLCCDMACSGCNACSNAQTSKADGTCAPVASGKDPHNACADETVTNQCGNDGTCDGLGACRKVSSSHVCTEGSCSSDGKTYTPGTTCDGLGACTVATPQSCVPFQCATTGCLKTCTTQADCGAGNYCNTTTGTCAATKPNGTAATQTYECTSGIVADGVCCDKTCTGCSACTSALNGQASTTTGQCLPVIANMAAPHSACAASPPCGLDGTCDGSGACHYPAVNTSCSNPSCSGSTLTTSACNNAHACVPASNPCPGSVVCSSASACKSATCSLDSDCITGYYCASGACTPKKTSGTCSSPNQCSTGYCIDGYCCDQGCTGQCQSCSQTPGTCKSVTTPRSPCGGSGTCATMKCDGTQPNCVYPGTEVACPSTCSTDLTSRLTSTCNGSGSCGPTQSNSCGSSSYCTSGQCASKLADNTAGCPGNVACVHSNCSSSPVGDTMCCAQNWTNCGSGCYDLSSDAQHCNGCSTNCGPNKICSSSNCQCTGSQLFCGTCGSWNFESNTVEGWRFDPWGYSNGVSNLRATTSRFHEGSHSLAFTMTNSTSAYVVVPLCSGNISTSVVSLSVWTYLESATAYPSRGYDLAYFMTAAGGDASGTSFQSVTGSWYHATRTINSEQDAYFAIRLSPSSPWSGTVYIDLVELSPG